MTGERLSAMTGRLPPGCLVALGVFDGVHLGHRALLAQMVAEGREMDVPTAAVTFEPHPLEVLSPERAPGRLMLLEERLRRIGDLGVGRTVVLRFDRRLAALRADDFVGEYLLREGAPAGVYVGFNFTFGKSGAGTAETLTELGSRHGFVVRVVPPVTVGGVTVSSTLIRDLIAEGRVREAAVLLGRPHRLSGKVGAGDGFGRKLGFPTANIVPDESLVLPATGVYAATVAFGGEEHPAAINVGVRPTLGGGAVRVEAHLLDYEGVLYGSRLEIIFAERLREERRFRDTESLRRQIADDVLRARAMLHRMQSGCPEPAGRCCPAGRCARMKRPPRDAVNPG